jgi:hypothetical protein
MATESRSGPSNSEEGTELRLPCLQCEGRTFHRVVRSAEYVTEYEEYGFSLTSWDEFQIVECLGCRAHSFRQRHRDTENVHSDEDTGAQELEERIELFPKRDTSRAEMDGIHHLPLPIQRVYGETLTALRNAMPVLAGIGIRAIVETVCKERDAQGGSLERRIDDLVTQGVLTKDGAEILHRLRIMGNEAAHEVKPHDTTDLNAAMDVIEYVLTGVYLLSRKAANLPARRST